MLNPGKEAVLPENDPVSCLLIFFMEMGWDQPGKPEEMKREKSKPGNAGEIGGNRLSGMFPALRNAPLALTGL